MIYLCNENLPSIEIYFDNENCRSNFIEKYKKYQNIQKFEDKYEALNLFDMIDSKYDIKKKKQ